MVSQACVKITIFRISDETQSTCDKCNLWWMEPAERTRWPCMLSVRTAWASGWEGLTIESPENISYFVSICRKVKMSICIEWKLFFLSIDRNNQRHWQHTAQPGLKPPAPVEWVWSAPWSLETSQRSFPSRVSPLSSERLQNCRAIPHQFARVQWQITARAFTEFIINSQSRSGQTRA